MNAFFKKLNYKDQKEIIVVNSPQSLSPALEEMSGKTTVSKNLRKGKKIEFILAFVTKQKEVDELALKVAEAFEGDAVIWFAYPKGTSKKYQCEFNRDTGWQTLGKLGFEGVRMVAIDEDWSALRFRKAEFIKTMTRSFAMSEEGKRKTAARKKSGTSLK